MSPAHPGAVATAERTIAEALASVAVPEAVATAITAEYGRCATGSASPT